MSEEFTQTLASFVLELVQIKSVNGQDLDGETAVATRIHKEATKLGLESQVMIGNNYYKINERLKPPNFAF
jgi:acetylornithine deacetylase/succinyl-diaminopimelate desuccinylase-like protein